MSLNIMGKTSELSRRLDALIQRVQELDPSRDMTSMRAQILSARPFFGSELQLSRRACGRPLADDQLDKAIDDASQMAVVSVKGLPNLIAGIVQQIDRPTLAPAHRCSLLSMLAYLTNSRDLIPDDAPGGYGLLDDYIIGMACALQLNEALGNPEQNQQFVAVAKLQLSMLLSLVSDSVAAQINEVLNGLALLVQTMAVLPAELADLTCEQLMNAPSGAVAPAAPAGWTPPSYAAPMGGHWSNGGYFEGGNMIAPGGASLIDGQISLPT